MPIHGQIFTYPRPYTNREGNTVLAGKTLAYFAGTRVSTTRDANGTLTTETIEGQVLDASDWLNRLELYASSSGRETRRQEKQLYFSNDNIRPLVARQLAWEYDDALLVAFIEGEDSDKLPAEISRTLKTMNPRPLALVQKDLIAQQIALRDRPPVPPVRTSSLRPREDEPTEDVDNAIYARPYALTPIGEFMARARGLQIGEELNERVARGHLRRQPTIRISKPADPS